MVGNSTSVTAGPARMPAPSTAAAARPAAADRELGTAGKNAAQGGQNLPPERTVASPADVEDTVRRLNDLMAERQRSLSFHVDEASGRTVITVRDATTAQVVRQIPAEEVLAVARAFEATGVLLDAQV